MDTSTVTPFRDDQRQASSSPAENAIRRVADQMHRLNHAIVQAVQAGLPKEPGPCDFGI